MNNVGTKIYGYCNGFFGRDDYDNKIIIFEGRTWIVCAYLGNSDLITCVNFESQEEKQHYIDKWSEEDCEDE